MKKSILFMSLLAGSFLLLPSAFAGNIYSKDPSGKAHINRYHISEVGYGTVYPLGGDRYRIVCHGTAGTCWGISEEGGRWYIDVFDVNGNMDSWWLTSLPLQEPHEPGISSQWHFDADGHHE